MFVARIVLVETRERGTSFAGTKQSQSDKTESKTNRLRGLNRANQEVNVGLP